MSSMQYEIKRGRFRAPLWLASFAAMLSMPFAVVSHAAESAEQRYRDLEALLMRAGRFDVKAHIVSAGAVASDLTADVGVANAGIVVIRMKGTMQGKPDHAVLRTDGVVTMIGKDGKETRLQPGKSMRQSVQFGLVRVGLWHNLLLLSHGEQPEHNQGGILQWADVANVRYTDQTKKGMTGLSFDVIIEGSRAGHATLWLDDASKMPIRREQSITVDGKTIKTVEEYSNFVPTS